ncbi:MAG TPA: hypothetical protein VH855_16435 [Acetobacteraceae bacterium]
MRLMTAIAACILTAGPIVGFGPSAHSQQNDFLGQAQRFLNNNNSNSQSNEDAYRRGRQDEMRREQVQRDRRSRHDDDQRWSNRDLDRDSQYRGQDRDTYNYNRYP